MNKSWKVALVFVGIFLAGGIAGGFISLLAARSFVRQRGGPTEFAIVHKGRFHEALKLSAAQKARIDAIVDETSEELKKVRRETGRLLQSMESRISSELTADQRREFEAMQQRWRDRRGKLSPGGSDVRGGKHPPQPSSARPGESPAP
ncbi:MAG: hypothetical protein KBA71_02585 [Opitutaceae bacterium]|nr:hypothetical protein [Opitutaceae bacterium]